MKFATLALVMAFASPLLASGLGESTFLSLSRPCIFPQSLPPSQQTIANPPPPSLSLTFTDGQSSSGSTLEVRREAAARSLAARRLRRSIESIRESQPLAERDVEARATKKTTTKAKVVALEDIYCGKNDKVCVNKAKKSDVPEGGRVACSTETLRCEARFVVGFSLISLSRPTPSPLLTYDIRRCPYGTTLKNKACVKSESKCGKTTCPKKPSNGSYSCYGGKCSLQCETGFNRNALVCCSLLAVVVVVVVE